MVWGPLIAWYLFLAGASAGAFLTAAFVEAKYPDSNKMRIAGRIIAPVFLGLGLLMLMIDAEAGLHNPLRFFWLVSNPGSVMTLGVYFICVYMPVALAAAVLEILKKKVPKWLTWIGIVFAFAVAAYTGFLAGGLEAEHTGRCEGVPVVEQRHPAHPVRGVGAVGGPRGHVACGPRHRSRALRAHVAHQEVARHPLGY